MRARFLLLALLATPASAQQLAYEPVDQARIAYAPVPETKEETPHPWLRYALLDRFEYAAQRGQDGYAWDFSALIGGETNRLWLASVGEGPVWGSPDYLELMALYSRNVGGGLDLNAGLRWDALPSPERFYAVVGGQWEHGNLWLGGFAFLSHEGELSGRLVGVYNHPLTRALLLQPSFELDAYGEDIEELGIGRGFTYAELGLRLRYEIDPRFAPYLGFSWERSLGRTARIEREAGDDPETRSLVFGLRSEF